MSGRQLTNRCGEARSSGDLAPHERVENMSKTRDTELKQMLETRRCELQSDLGAKLRDVRENSGYEREMLGVLDAAAAAISNLYCPSEGRSPADTLTRCGT